jgi:hypothetical protein
MPVSRHLAVAPLASAYEVVELRGDLFSSPVAFTKTER